MNSHKTQLIAKAQVFTADGKLKKDYSVSPKETLMAKVVITLRDALGNITNKMESPFRSYNSNFSKWLNYALFLVDNGAADSNQITDTSAAALATTHNCKLTAAATDDTYGIFVGTASTDPTLADYIMSTKVAHGAGAGALMYGSTTVTPIPVTTGGTDYNKIHITRFFDNTSGGDITIRETGIAGLGTTAGDYFLIARDNQSLVTVDGETVTDMSLLVPDGQIAEVKYILTLDNDVSVGGLTSNWLGFLASEFKDAAVSVKNYLGTQTAVDFTAAQASKLLLNVAATNDDYGIMIGASNSSFEITDYKLLDRIIDSSVDYGAMTLTGLEELAEGQVKIENYSQIGCTRDFTSQETDTTVIVREAALVLNKGAGTAYYTIARIRFADASSIRGTSGDGISLEPSEVLRLTFYFKHILFEEDGISGV